MNVAIDTAENERGDASRKVENHLSEVQYLETTPATKRHATRTTKRSIEKTDALAAEGAATARGEALRAERAGVNEPSKL